MRNESCRFHIAGINTSHAEASNFVICVLPVITMLVVMSVGWHFKRFSQLPPIYPIAPTGFIPMPLLELSDFIAIIRPGSAVLGLDLGEKTIGVAASDRGLSLSTPVETIQRRKIGADLVRLGALAKDRDVKGFVLGLPLNMDGSKGTRVQITQSFAHEILKAAAKDRSLFGHIDPPILLWDERLSTSAVDRFLVDEADLSRKKRAAVVDKMAASFILQGALDAMANQRG